ncbi:hypothetical protein PCYB_124150 [Plasmodium cynomolgi strain B]|uniref:Uncharacterized protein n=1 Tax=Plasmodium cynomolgi (strain B) TaxID=1120755 RepID=K6UW49_PLACD|nr:hypothetical protein PCYB_124150 [Plasmodium cynomolgi strain B]GAB67849.1 hypothetical protein PCYB_124150 [Plasmodium cynomolgi strain B]
MLNNNGFNGGVNQMNEYQGGMNFQGNGPFPGGGQFQASGNSEQRQHNYGELQNCNNDFYSVQKVNAVNNNQGFPDRHVMYGNDSYGRPPHTMEEIPNYYHAKGAMGGSPMGGIPMPPAEGGFNIYQNKNNLPFFGKEQNGPNYNDQALFSQVKQNVSIFGNKTKNNTPLFGSNVKNATKADLPSVSLYDFVSHDKSIFGNRLKEGKPLFINEKNTNQSMQASPSQQHGNSYLMNNNNMHNMAGHGGDKNYMSYNYDAKGQVAYGMNPPNDMVHPNWGGGNINGMNHPGNQLLGNAYNQNNFGTNMESVPPAHAMHNTSTQNVGKEINCASELQGEEVLFTNENEIMFEKNYVREYGMEGNTQMGKMKKILFFNKNFVKSLEQIASHNLNSYNENRSTIYTFPCSMSSNNVSFYMQAIEDCKKESRFDVDANLYNKIFTKQNMQQAFSVLKNINMNKKMDPRDIDLDIYYPLLHVERIKFRQPVTAEHSRKSAGAPFQLGQIPTVI